MTVVSCSSRARAERASATPRRRLAGTARVLAALGTTLVAGASATAQAAPLPPLPGPPIRRIESASAISTEPLGAITTVRPLGGGHVLVNDGQRRRLLLLDSTLAVVRVVLDSLTEVENAYGTRPGALLAAPGDSTLFVDPATYAMLILDPQGRIARVRSVPRAQDVNALANTSNGTPGFDARGRLVYRVSAQPARPTVPPPRGVPWIPSPPDSAFVVAIDLASRRVDTLAAVRTPKTTLTVRQQSNGGIDVSSVTSPLPLVDDWGVLPDGTIALLRGRDYRVEWLHADGSITSSEKLPFPWVRLTDDDKTRFVDSTRAQQLRGAQTSYTTQTIVWSNLLNKPFPPGFTVFAGYTLPPGIPRDWVLPDGLTFPARYRYGCPPRVAPGTATGADSGCVANGFSEYYGNGYTPPAPTYRAPTIVRPEDLPDYRPPFGTGAMRVDADGNLWVRTVPMRPTPGGAVYDVIARAGGLTDRIQLPSGYTLVGFAPGKVVYLSMRDASGLHLARVRLR